VASGCRRIVPDPDPANLQGFHDAPIALPRRLEDRPDRARLETRFERFSRAAA
jgi:hypothetical protein